MKYFIALILLFFTIPVYSFSDIEHNWYKVSIINLKDLWVINGFSDGKYLPHDTITRAEILKIILNTSWLETSEPEAPCFIDISNNDWYTKYICSGAKKEIVNGYPDGSFNPGWSVTVIEAIAFGSRAFDLDISSTWEWEEWYNKYQDFTHENNIIPVHSYTKNTLISRWQAAELIWRMKQFSDTEELNYLSSGCDINPEISSGEYTIDIWWVQRKYLLYVPEGIKKWQEMSLIVAFHGRTNSNEMVRDYMKLGWGSYGNTRNQKDFIVAYPAGKWSGPYSWTDYENIKLFDAIVSKVSQSACIDRDTVFAVGHSLWSWMSNKVSCQRGDVIRAMVWVASSWYDWECTWPVTSLITHLPWDPLASYTWGQWAYKIRSEKNLCEAEEKPLALWDLKSCIQKTSCTPGNTTIFCNSYTTYGNDQHSWPKEWSDEILDFFESIDDYAIY